MRGLQELDDEPAVPPVPESKRNLHSTNLTRADSVVSKVIRSLGPLVRASRMESLKSDLFAVAKSSIDIWNDAQVSGLRITINRSLDRTRREEWRSQQFDPISPPADGFDPDLVSKTHPRVFTLFPRIVARMTQDTLVPGSWPELEEIVIHPGIGLPEWSPLVVRGKRDVEEEEEKVKSLRKEHHKSKRGPGQSRNGSIVSPTSGPSSPIAQWKNGGAVKFGEE